MTEQEIEELLGAYALDAIDPEEREQVEQHLATCPRCRGEVAAHREVAALLANSGADAPEGLWDRIADELSPELSSLALNANDLIAHLPRNPQHSRKRAWAFPASIVAAAAVTLVIALLSVQVANLSREVNPGSNAAVGMSAAVKSALAHPHRTILLTSTTKRLDATVAVSSDGNAYWVGSNLAKLPKSKTYQLWTIVRGNTVVSLGVLGANPTSTTAFRLESDMSQLMVTVEPEGGTPEPTLPIIVQAPI